MQINNNDLQIISGAVIPVDTSPVTYTQHGENNIQIGHIENYTNNINNFMPNGYPIGNIPVAIPELSREYYNLFVVEDESFFCGYFSISKELALTKSWISSLEIFLKFAHLNEAAIAQIKTFPSIFASVNHNYGHTDLNHTAIFGVVTNVIIRKNDIVIYFDKYDWIPQQRLNKLTDVLGIFSASVLNELNDIHWTIKRINLIDKLISNGIKLKAPMIISK